MYFMSLFKYKCVLEFSIMCWNVFLHCDVTTIVDKYVSTMYSQTCSIFGVFWHALCIDFHVYRYGQICIMVFFGSIYNVFSCGQICILPCIPSFFFLQFSQACSTYFWQICIYNECYSYYWKYSSYLYIYTMN